MFGNPFIVPTRFELKVLLELLWEPYPSYHNGLFSPLLVRRDFAAREADHYRSDTSPGVG